MILATGYTPLLCARCASTGDHEPSALYLFLHIFIHIQWDGTRDCLPPRPLNEHQPRLRLRITPGARSGSEEVIAGDVPRPSPV